MNEIKKAIEQIAAEEYERANKKFPLFHSDHEGLAVIEEEIVETGADWSAVTEYFGELKISVFTNDEIGKIIDAQNIREYAVNACAECIQVIAMCDKFIESKTKREAGEC